MKKQEIVIIEEKKSPLKTIFLIVTTVATVLVTAIAVYKFIENKIMPKIVDRVDIDGDGQADAIMLDTTGNGEIDTIVLTDLNEEGTDEE